MAPVRGSRYNLLVRLVLLMAYLIAQGGSLAMGLEWATAAYLVWLGYQLCMHAFLAGYSGVNTTVRVWRRGRGG